MLVFCVKKVEQKARADAVGDIIRPSELLDLALEDDGEEYEGAGGSIGLPLQFAVRS